MKGGRRSPPAVIALTNHTPGAEAYRTLRAHLEFAQVSGPLRQLAIVSAEPAAGKSTVSLNLALTMARSGTRVCLVDTDFRHPSLHGPLQARPNLGVTNVLMGKVAPERALQQTLEPNLTFLASGPLPPNPAALLGSQAMRRLIGELGRGFEAVLYDTPPLGVASDAAILSALVDGALLVARLGHTTRAAVEEARRSLEQARVRIVGCVANRAPIRRSQSYGYYPYGGVRP